MLSTPTCASDRHLAAPVDGSTAEQVRAVQAVAEHPEVVLRRGGGVALVEEGTLSSSGGIALAMRQQP